VYKNSIARDWGRPGATSVGYRPPATRCPVIPLQFLILLVASWIGRRQGEAIEYLRAENRVLRAWLGHKRLRSAGRGNESISVGACELFSALPADADAAQRAARDKCGW